MDTSPDGIKKIMDREGVKLKSYRDSGGIWTICVGHTSQAGPPKVRQGMALSRDECQAILRHDLSAVEDCVERSVKTLMTQNQFDALVSLVFNIGCGAFRKSSVLRHFNRGDRQRAADSFLLWNKVRGRVVNGLVNRRRAEREQFLGRGAT